MTVVSVQRDEAASFRPHMYVGTLGEREVSLNRLYTLNTYLLLLFNYTC